MFDDHASRYCGFARAKRGGLAPTHNKGDQMTKLLWSLIVAFALVAAPGYAQDQAADTNMQILRDKLKADKKALVAANMPLSDKEAKAFWPIYDAYQNDLHAINERIRKAILAYADAYKAGPIPDPLARKFLDEAIGIDEAEAKVRRDYSVKLTRALPVAKAVRYLQIENKIRAAIRYEFASAIPLVN
jgi:hypothetical protein